MKILFLTKSKPYTIKILQELVVEKHMVTVVCKSYESFKGSEMDQWCAENGISVIENDELYSKENLQKFSHFDLGISNTYGRLIKKPLIDALKGRIFNIHAAPLPTYKGMFVYNWALYNGEESWTVTAHYVNEKFDEGPIIRTKSFPIDAEKTSVKELEECSSKVGYELTMEIVDAFLDGKKPEGFPQKGEGNYYSKKDFEDLKVISEKDSANEIRKKVHACFCPPYEGAYFLKEGEKFFVLTAGLIDK